MCGHRSHVSEFFCSSNSRLHVNAMLKQTTQVFLSSSLAVGFGLCEMAQDCIPMRKNRQHLEQPLRKLPRREPYYMSKSTRKRQRFAVYCTMEKRGLFISFLALSMFKPGKLSTLCLPPISKLDLLPTKLTSLPTISMNQLEFWASCPLVRIKTTVLGLICFKSL